MGHCVLKQCERRVGNLQSLYAEQGPSGKVIRLKYLIHERGWFVKTPRGSYGVGMWKDVSKETRRLKQNCCFIFGDGNKIRFWEDSWCGEGPLCEPYPALFALADSKEALVANVWDTSRGEGVWNLSFVRSFND